MRRRLLLAATLLLASCAHVQHRPSPSPALRLAPATLDASLSLQQRLTVTHGARTQRVDALLEVDENTLRLVLLVGPKRMLTLMFDGESVEETRDPALPEALAGERFVDDIQLAYWPAAAIRRMISSILAGYAWDTANPYVAEPQRRLRVLEGLCG